MDWLPHIVVKAEDDVSIPTSVTALKTFSTGFPDTKATVSYTHLTLPTTDRV